MKVLIIRFSSIGDIVLTTPVVRCLKQQRPDIELHYLTRFTFHALLDHNPYIDHIHLLHDDLAGLNEILKKEKYDHIVDLHHNLRTMRVKKALKAPAWSFPKLNIQKWILTNLKINTMPSISIVERYFETVKELGVRNDGKGLDYFFPSGQALSNTDIPMSHWGGFVGFVIGGSCGTKKLPVARWQELCDLVPYPIMLLGGPDDRYDGDQVAEKFPVKVYNSCGKFNINESAELTQLAKVIVSNDTGLMHIAAAFKKPIVSLWGNTSPAMGMFPYYGFNDLKNHIAPQSVIMENKQLGCHPCSKIGYDTCPRRHFRCMNELDMHMAAEHVKALWANGATKAPGSKP